MDKLLGWVKQIFVISILSELVIHILPDEKYEGVVRLLCGCMITAACIMPVLNFINAEYDADIDLFAKTSQISELRSQIRFSGKDSSDVMIEKYIETQQEFVTKKVMEEGFTPSEVEIVIKALVAEETTKSGIVLPGQAKEKPQQAEVVAVGPGGMVDGKEVKMQVKAGDKIIYSKYAGTEVKLEDEEYIIVKQSDILAIIE